MLNTSLWIRSLNFFWYLKVLIFFSGQQSAVKSDEDYCCPELSSCRRIIVSLVLGVGNTFRQQNVWFHKMSKRFLPDQLWEFGWRLLFLCLLLSSEVADNRKSESHCDISFPHFADFLHSLHLSAYDRLILCFILKSDLWLNVNEIEFSLCFHYILLVWTFFKAAHQNPLFSMNK